MNTSVSPNKIAKYNHVPLSARLEHLVGNKHCSDFTFIIEEDNVEIPAHKLIVALASPVLERIVYGNETFSPADSIKVDGISKESFMQILNFIYTDTIDVNDDNVFEILHKSNYFGLPGIEMECFKYLEENLNVSTVPWIYHQLFYAVPLCKLLNKCLQYIRIQPLQFFASEYFEKISTDELKSILQLDTINCTEVDLFEAVIKLSRARCAAIGLELTGANLRKVVDGIERLLRLESLSESELDRCLEIERDFYSPAEVKRIRENNVQSIVKRKFYTYEDAVWIRATSNREMPPSAYYSGFQYFIRRCFDEYGGPEVLGISHNFGPRVQNVEVLCGRGYKWQTFVNGDIPLGAVSLSQKDFDPVFIARSLGQITTLHMNGKLKNPSESSESEILVADNVKNPYNGGNEALDDAIFIGFDDNNLKTYLGVAWFRNDLLPAKVILQSGAFVPYGTREERVHVYEFVHMDPGTYEWVEDMNGSVPENAVLAGVTANGEDLYFGRVMHNGNYIPGKVHKSHGVLYIPYRELELNFNRYEVLVHAQNVSGVSAVA